MYKADLSPLLAFKVGQWISFNLCGKGGNLLVEESTPTIHGRIENACYGHKISTKQIYLDFWQPIWAKGVFSSYATGHETSEAQPLRTVPL
jgi:hypothetical protein